MYKHSLFFFLMVAGSAVGQVVSFGVEGGIPLTDRTSPPDESRPYIVGPSVEIRLPARFALRVEALYQRVGTIADFFEIPAGVSVLTNGLSFTNRTRANVWEFPFLGKYYFRPRSAAWQPYFETGWALRDAWVHTSGTETPAGSSSFSFKQDFRTPLDVGAVAGAGARIPMGRLALSPEVRYTRWGSQYGLLRKNEASILLGVHF